MDSQGAMFEEEIPDRLSTLDYEFVILFNWNDGAKKRFKMFRKTTFGKEIQENCISKILKNDYRIKKLKPLTVLPGVKVSLFAKVESGNMHFHEKNCFVE